MYTFSKQVLSRVFHTFIPNSKDTSNENRQEHNTDVMLESDDANKNKNLGATSRVTPALNRKRTRDGLITPLLSFSPSPTADSTRMTHNAAPSKTGNKRVRLDPSVLNKIPTLKAKLDSSLSSNSNPSSSSSAITHASASLLDIIPQEVLQTNVFSYLTSAKDYYSLQLTNKKINYISNQSNILEKVDLNADLDTNVNCILNLLNTPHQEVRDCISIADENIQSNLRKVNKEGKGSILYNIHEPADALKRLYKYAKAGNLQATYMTGMIISYCHGDALGVTILRQNASKGCNRSAYTLGLILRDCNKSESESFLRQAVENNYLPACQELLSSAQVKELFGDLDHVTLQRFFDPIALNRLLGRAYLNSAGVRRVSTSHCWNPCCGRWALKATQNNSRRPTLQFPGKYLPPIEKNLERDLFRLVDKLGKESQDEDVSWRAYAQKCFGVDDSCVGVESGSSSSGSDEISDDCVARVKSENSLRVSRMKMCSSCRRAKYCSKLCQVYDWRSGQHKVECQYLT